MKKRILNLQMYAVKTQPLSQGAQITGQFLGSHENQTKIEEFIKKQQVEAIYEEDTLKEYFAQEYMPANSGKTMLLKRDEPYDANINEYGENVEITIDSPIKKTYKRIALKGIGGAALYTDEDVMFAKDGMTLINDITEGQAKSVAEKMCVYKYEACKATSNIWYMGVDPNTTTNLDKTETELKATVGKFDLDELRKIKVALKRMHAKPWKDGKFYIHVSPEIVSDMFTLAKTGANQNYSFVELMMHTNSKAIEEGHIGDWNSFRFIENPVLSSEKIGNKDVCTCLIFARYQGKPAMVELKPEGMGEMKTAHKPIGSSGTYDLMDSEGGVSWKTYVGYGALYPEAIMKLYCDNAAGVSYPQLSSETLELLPNEVDYVRTISGNKDESLETTTAGTGTAAYTKPSYNNGKKK